MDLSEPPPQSLVELKDILQNSCSFTIQFDEKPNTISKEQSLVVKDIEKIVNEDKRVTGKIINGVNEIFLNEIYLKKALLPTVLKKEGVTFAIEQESLIRLLLRVNQLQEPVFKLLLEEMIKVCSDTEDCSMMRLLLNPLKYLPNINNSEDFSTNLLDLLELGSSELQLEMLDCIPDIIPDSCYDKVAEQLLRILNSGDSHWEAIIGCFGAFDFNENVREYIFGKLLDEIVPIRPDCFPATLKLLLNSHKGKISPKLFLKIRDMIHNIMTETEHHERKVNIVNVIRTISNKGNIVQSCLDLINTIKNSKEHKPFDLLMLLILGEDTKYKELIRKKVEAGHFTPELVRNLVLDPTFALLNEGWEALIKLAGYLLRFQSLKLKNFTVSLLNTVSSVKPQGVNPLMITKEIVVCLMKACFNSNVKCVHQALRIFYDLVLKYPEKFYDNWSKITGLLRKMDDFDFYSASLAYAILCYISSSVNPHNPQSEVMKSEISLVIRKQLMSSKRPRKCKGVIGSSMQLQSGMVEKLEGTTACGYTENDEENILELMDPLPLDVVEASSIIESISVLTEGVPECTGMFYDQCASYFCRTEVRKNFNCWMTRKIHDLLKNYIFVSNENMIEINNLIFQPQYAVEERQCYVMNIGLMAVEPHKYENNPLILLPSLLYVYRSLQFGKNIESLLKGDYIYFLNCSFMLPDMENLDDLNCSQLKQVADVLYHTINFLKEVVAATIWGEILCKTFHNRLKLLIKFETMFDDVLRRIPEHTFPQPYFNDCMKNKQLHEIKKKPVGRKTKKQKVVHDETTASTSILTGRDLNNTSSLSILTSKAPKVAIRHSRYHVEHNIKFREIDYSALMQIIQFPNCLEDSVSSNEDDSFVRLDNFHLVFILRYLVRQLRALLGNPMEPSVTLTPEKIVDDISYHLNDIVERFTEIVHEIDSLDVFDDENETHCDIMMCYWHFLEMFFIILSAPIEQPCQLMDKIHLCLEVDKEKNDTRKNVIATFSKYFHKSLLLSHSVLIYQIINKILDYQPSKDSIKLKVLLCEKMVTKKWSSSKTLLYSEKQMNQDTKFIVEEYFAEKKVNELHEFVTKLMEEHASLADRNYHLPFLLIINHSNFHILFVCLCKALQENVDKEVQWILKQNCSRMEHLKLWKNTTNAMFILMNIARNELTKHNILLCTFLKKSIPILKLFIAQALPVFDMMFSSKPETVIEILKTMQSSTRFLHHLCCQSKTFKNLSVISHIPSFRLVLETLIYKVKALLVSHNCEDAFFLGNLKNKDIHGNTQTSEQIEEDISQENEQEDDDEILASDNESDVNMEDDRSESLTF